VSTGMMINQIAFPRQHLFGGAQHWYHFHVGILYFYYCFFLINQLYVYWPHWGVSHFNVTVNHLFNNFFIWPHHGFYFK